MAVQTEADKKDFIHFMIGILTDNSGTIKTEGNQNVLFDTDGHKNMLEGKNQTIKKEEGKEKAAEDAKLKQTALANKVLEDGYTSASASAEAVVKHMGEDHTLSKIIRKERAGLHQDENPPTTP